MKAAETLYQLGRLKRAGVPFTECEIPELWNRTKNGTYAVLATRLLRSNTDLNKTSLWLEIQRAVRREIRASSAAGPRVGEKCRAGVPLPAGCAPAPAGAGTKQGTLALSRRDLP